jgi:hypothetical protein
MSGRYSYGDRETSNRAAPLGGSDRHPWRLPARLPELLPADSGLKAVAELCKRDFAARPARDWNDVRDQLLLIGIEWNLDCDWLDQQSECASARSPRFAVTKRSQASRSSPQTHPSEP